MTLKTSIKKIHNHLTGKPNPKPNREIDFLDLYQLVGYASESTLEYLKRSNPGTLADKHSEQKFHPTLSWENDFEHAYQNEDGSYTLGLDGYIKKLKAQVEQAGLEKNITVEENPGKVFFRENGWTYHPQYKITVKDLRIRCSLCNRTFYFDSLPFLDRFFPKDSEREENRYNGSIYIEFKENVFESTEGYDAILALWLSLDYGTYAIFRGNMFKGVSLSLEQRTRGGTMLPPSFSRLENNIFKSKFMQVGTGSTYDYRNPSGVWPEPSFAYGFRTKFESLVEQHAASILQDSINEQYEEGEKLKHKKMRDGYPEEIAKIATSMYPRSKHGPIKITPDDIKLNEKNNNVAKILGNKFDHLILFGNGVTVLAKNEINNFRLNTNNIHFANVQKIEYMYNYKSILGDLKRKAIETEDRQERKILEKQIYKIECKNMKEDGYVSKWQRAKFRIGFRISRIRENTILIIAVLALLVSLLSR